MSPNPASLAVQPPSKAPPRAQSPRSVSRVLQILEELCSAPGGRSLATLSERLATPKSSLLNLLRGLVAGGYVVQAGREYRLGLGAFGLARAILALDRGADLHALARPVLERLAETTGETALLSVLASDRKAMVYAEKIESRTALRFAASVGDRRPIHCTASGRVMLAFLPPPWPEEFLRGAKLTAETPASITDRRTLRQIVEQVRAEGFAVTIGEATEGAAGIAAPVFGDTGTVVASVVLAGPVGRTQPRLRKLVQQVRAAADDLSRRLGHRYRPGEQVG